MVNPMAQMTARPMVEQTEYSKETRTAILTVKLKAYAMVSQRERPMDHPTAMSKALRMETSMVHPMAQMSARPMVEQTAY